MEEELANAAGENLRSDKPEEQGGAGGGEGEEEQVEDRHDAWDRLNKISVGIKEKKIRKPVRISNWFADESGTEQSDISSDNQEEEEDEWEGRWRERRRTG